MPGVGLVGVDGHWRNPEREDAHREEHCKNNDLPRFGTLLLR
jgi:hypothetical protein